MLAGALAPGCGKRRPVISDLPKPEKVFEGSAEGMSVALPDAKGRKAFHILAKHSDQLQVSGRVTLRDAEVTSFHQGKPYARVLAPSALLDTKARKVTLSGGIRARILQQPTSFRVDTMTWSADTKAFEGRGNASFTSGAVTLRGNRIAGKTPLTDIVVTENVRFQIGARP